METVSTALTTPRLGLESWRLDDATAALRIFGVAEVTEWLTPAVHRVADEAEMRATIAQWLDDDHVGDPPLG
ncbi:MAG: hypothetical protein ACRDPG_11070, partial [Nocardioidaceae bacterium]